MKSQQKQIFVCGIATKLDKIARELRKSGYASLKSTLEKIAADHPQSRIHELLPWNFDPTSS